MTGGTAQRNGPRRSGARSVPRYVRRTAGGGGKIEHGPNDPAPKNACQGGRRNFSDITPRPREDPIYPRAIVAPTGSPDEQTNRRTASNPENPDPAQRSRIRRFGWRAMQIAMECVKKPTPADATRTRRRRVFAVPGGDPALADAGGVPRRVLPRRPAKDPGAPVRSPRRHAPRHGQARRRRARRLANCGNRTRPGRSATSSPAASPREAVRRCRACEEIGRLSQITAETPKSRRRERQ